MGDCLSFTNMISIVSSKGLPGGPWSSLVDNTFFLYANYSTFPFSSQSRWADACFLNDESHCKTTFGSVPIPPKLHNFLKFSLLIQVDNRLIGLLKLFLISKWSVTLLKHIVNWVFKFSLLFGWSSSRNCVRKVGLYKMFLFIHLHIIWNWYFGESDHLHMYLFYSKAVCLFNYFQLCNIYWSLFWQVWSSLRKSTRNVSKVKVKVREVSHLQ